MKQCSRTVLHVHNSATGTCDTPLKDDIVESAETPASALLATFPNAVLDDLTVNPQDLPILRPDPSFGVPGAGSDCVPPSPLTPTSALFDYVRYTDDASTHVEEACKEQEEGGRWCP